jgi:hypothetical protein
MNTTRIFVATMLASLSLWAAPATAQTPPTTTTPAERFANLDRMLAEGSLVTPGSTQGIPTFSEMEALTQRYQGTTAAFSQYWAQNSNQTLGTWFAANAAALSTSLAIPALNASTLASSPGELQASLTMAGFSASPTLDWTTYAKDIQRDPLAAPIVSRSMDFAALSAQMRMPDITKLTAGLSTTGIFAERAITAMVTDHPDLISQVQNGVLSPESQKAWKASMKNAAAAALPNVTDGLIDPCQASMLWAMGSGSAAGARAIGGKSCGSCVTQGLYMHESMKGLLGQAQNTTSSVIPPSDYNMIPEWRRAAIATKNPKVTSTPSFAVSASGCSSSATAASKTVVSGTIGNLRGTK